MTLPVKIVFRAPSQYPLLFTIREAGLWEENGLDANLTLIRKTAVAEETLESGRADFIFGNHITPYRKRFFRGIPFVYLGQTVNYTDDILITRQGVTGLTQLVGKTFSVDPLRTAEGHLVSHPRLHVDLYLERAGMTIDQIQILEPEEKSPITKLKTVASGQADATIVASSAEIQAQALGLQVTALDPLPMIQSVTLLGLGPIVLERPDMVKQVLKTMSRGIKFFCTKKSETCAILSQHVAPELGLTTEAEVEQLYDRTAARLEPTLMPTIAAITNVFKEACIFDPEVKDFNPLVMWDLHFLRELQEEGFFNE